jgi:hypothetical protein
MIRFVATSMVAFAFVACGGSSLPPAKVVDAQSAITAAAAVGAENNPQAALHLKMARDQVKQADKLIAAGEDAEARLVLEKAQADAEVALIITREADAAAKVMKANADVQNLNRTQ